jgi:hypothetical protein
MSHTLQMRQPVAQEATATDELPDRDLVPLTMWPHSAFEPFKPVPKSSWVPCAASRLVTGCTSARRR